MKRSSKQIDQEDVQVLKYAGMMGHEFVGIFTNNEGVRKLGCEANSMADAMRIMLGRRAYRVYIRALDGTWLRVAGSNRLGRKR